jgi:nitrogen regulatory protein P-II 1
MTRFKSGERKQSANFFKFDPSVPHMKRKSKKERIPVLKRIEIIIPHDKLEDAHNVLKDANVGGISHYKIEGSGRVKADPVVAATHPTHPHGYVGRTKVEVVVKDEQVEDLLSNLQFKLRGGQGGKIFVVDVPIAIDITTSKRGEEAI